MQTRATDCERTELDEFGPAGSEQYGRPIRPLPVLLICLLYGVALAGRFTFDRIGVEALEFLNIQAVGGIVVVAVTVLWRFVTPLTSYYHPWAPGIRLACLFAVYQCLSILWSPLTPFAVTVLVDFVVLLGLMIVTATLTGPDPRGAAHVFMWLMYLTGIGYAFGALAIGSTNVQGRLVFLGGGPNVFVRVVCLGALASVALAISRRNGWFLAPLPVMLVAAVLSGSRGGLVAAAVVVPLLLFAFRRHVRTGVASACAAAAVVVGVMAWESVGKRIPGVEYVIGLFEERGLSERPRLLEAAMDLFEQRPLFGVGIGGFYEQYGRAISLEYPHNFVAAVAAEGGIVGLVLLAMTLAAILSGVRGVSGRSAGQICCLLGAVYIGIASLISGDYYDSRFFWILIIVVINRGCRPGTPGGGSSGPARWRQSAPEVLTPRK